MIITKPIDQLLGAIIDRVSWDVFEFTPKAEASDPLHRHRTLPTTTTTPDASAPFISIGPSGIGGPYQTMENYNG